MNIIAHVTDPAFQSLLISSIETFPSAYIGNKAKNGKSAKPSKPKPHEGESFGLLFGQRMVKRDDVVFNVTLAVPMQTAKRKKDMVSYSRRHLNRIREVTESFPYLEFVGTFHSHPCQKDDYDARTISEFSDGDEASAVVMAQEYGDEVLEVILGITALDRHSRRSALMDGETIQSYCGRFKYSLSAYCTLGAAPDENDDDEEDDEELEIDEEDFEEMMRLVNGEDWDEEENWDEEDEDGEEEEDDEEFSLGLVPVDRLICPLAAHGGDIFGRTDLED